jgi:hypothetical protein
MSASVGNTFNQALPRLHDIEASCQNTCTRVSGPPKIHPPGGGPCGWFWCDIGANFPATKTDRLEGGGGLVAGRIFGGPNATVNMFSHDARSAISRDSTSASQCMAS